MSPIRTADPYARADGAGSVSVAQQGDPESIATTAWIAAVIREPGEADQQRVPARRIAPRASST
jgi:hypothetical protein